MKRLPTFPDSDVPLPTKAVPLALFPGKQFTVVATVAGRPRTFLFDTGEGLTMIGPRLAPVPAGR